jgi:hypothetical protein
LELCALVTSKVLNSTPKKIYLFAGYKPKTVKVFIAESLFTDMMYFPEKYDVCEMLEDFNLVACEQEYNEEARDFLPGRTMKITKKTEI